MDTTKMTEEEYTRWWETFYMKQQKGSWKDEIILAVLLFPYIGSFIPWLQDYVAEGWQVIGTAPTWWNSATLVVCLAIYGVRHVNIRKIVSKGLEVAVQATKK